MNPVVVVEGEGAKKKSTKKELTEKEIEEEEAAAKEEAYKLRKHQASVRLRERQRRLRTNGSVKLPEPGQPGRHPPPEYGVLQTVDPTAGWARETRPARNAQEVELYKNMRALGVPYAMLHPYLEPQHQLVAHAMIKDRQDAVKRLGLMDVEPPEYYADLREARNMQASQEGMEALALGRGRGKGGSRVGVRAYMGDAGCWCHPLVVRQ